MAEADDDDDTPGVPEWIVTYGDMMSLLLTFFIMLVSMSELKTDNAKTRTMMDAIRQAFGPTKGEKGAPGRSLQSTSALSERSSRSSRAKGGLGRGSNNSRGPGGAHGSVMRINEGTVVSLGGPARFARFDATMSEELKRTLKVIARVVGPKPQRIIVRGHATPEPIPSDAQIASTLLGCSLPLPGSRAERRLYIVRGLVIRDPFDLSFARARAVADFLISLKIDPRRIQISAVGETEKRLNTREKEKRKLNRRVDVFLIDSYIAPRKPVKGR